MIYDLVIIGGGPAGAALASLLPEGEKILLIEGDSREKTCGGLLSPDAQVLLARLGRTLPKEVLVSPQIFSVRTIDLETRKEQTYARNYLNMSRGKFDAWMRSLIPEHIDRLPGTVHKILPESGGYVLEGRAERPFRIHSRRIVGADGAGSLVRSTLFAPLETRKMVAFQQWFDAAEEDVPPMYTALFDSETSPACSWTIEKEGCLLFGGIFSPENTREQFERQKEKLRTFGFQLISPLRSEGCSVLWPTSQESFQTGSDTAFLIGEAAGFISPSSFEGISYAIESAILLKDALYSPFPSIIYRNSTAAMRKRLLGKLLKAKVMYTPMLRAAALRSGLSALRRY